MRKILLCLIGILSVLIEGSITNNINIFETSFNITLIYLTIIALYLDEIEVGIIGIIVGLMKDLLYGGIFGASSLSFFIISYGISYLREKIYKESYITIFTLIFITSVIDSIINLILNILMYKSYGLAVLAIKGIILIPLLNSLFSLVIYRIFKKYILKLKED